MPRIRKKTSKRGTTHQRTKVKHKAAESRKKTKKEAKKNPQWKSKHKKDPGIPNNFPFKDQVLAEIAAQKRQEEEEKQKRKEQRKTEKAAAKTADEDENEDDVSGFLGISSLGSSALKAPVVSSAKGKGRSMEVDENEDAPILINSEYKDLRSVLDKTDVVLHVLDAREPLASCSKHLQEYVEEKKGKGKVVLVLNKIDACPREVVRSWASSLRKEAPTFLFRSASAFLPQEQQSPSSANKEAKKLSYEDAVGTGPLLDFLSKEAATKEGTLSIAIVGVANTGKSSLVNSLLQKAASPIYKLTSAPSGPSTTERPVEVILDYNGKQFTLIDTPALSWEHPSDMDGGAAAKQRANDMLLRSKGRIDKAKEPIVPVHEIVSRADAEDLMLFYTLPAFTPGDGAAFLAALARARGLVKGRGEIDRVAAARLVLRDWGVGRLPRYALPPPPPSSSDGDAPASEKGEDERDEDVLKAAPPRKEMRKGCGIVRLKPRGMETRRVQLDEKWDEEEDGEKNEEGRVRAGEEESVGDEEGEVDEDDNEGHDEEEDEDEEDEEFISEEEADAEEEDDEEDDIPDLPPPTSKGKRKRPSGPPPALPAPKTKKVAFAPHPKGSKHARAQPSSKFSKKPVKATAKPHVKSKRR